MKRLRSEPNAQGYWGEFGGRFVAETLVAPLEELTKAFHEARRDRSFKKQLADLQRNYSGRPTPLGFAERLTSRSGGARIFLKREDLLHTGAHKINNALGQGLLAQRMGKRRIIAETGAGQHGVATATVCALLGLDCIVYMGAEDVRRQEPNVLRMRLLGAEVRVVESGSRTLKDAINEALRDWVANARDTYYSARQRARSASISADGARISECDRRRNAPAISRARKKVAECNRRLHWRRVERDRNVPSFSRGQKCSADWCRSRRERKTFGRTCGAFFAERRGKTGRVARDDELRPAG